METKLERISQLSRENPDMVFTSIGHLINKDLLRKCHEAMDGGKAVGIDGVTKEEYGQNLDENLDGLVERLKRKAYKPQPARRVEIPKDNGKTRPLSIYCYEDKLVQAALKEVLEAVFEPLFPDTMMGFRPGRGCHQALRSLNFMIEKRLTHYVVDADIRGFFDNLDHEWIIQFIEKKIKDPNIIRLVRRMLKAGIMKDFQWEPSLTGSGQGSVCSPVIANIYMYYVLAWWFEMNVRPFMRGNSGLVIYADDFVACFQYKDEAEKFYRALIRRLGRFGLSLAEEKSRLIEFGWFAEENRRKRGEGKPETFDFLGFTHYCSKSRDGRFRVKRKTSRKKFTKKCKEMNQRIKKMRNCELSYIFKKLNETLVGYYHYYGITDNYDSLELFRRAIVRMLYKWLNRRSQRKSCNWEQFNDILAQHPLARPKIYVNIYQW